MDSCLPAYGQAISAIQELLTEDYMDNLLPSFLLTGQQTPAFGRRVSGVIEIPDEQPSP